MTEPEDLDEDDQAVTAITVPVFGAVIVAIPTRIAEEMGQEGLRAAAMDLAYDWWESAKIPEEKRLEDGSYAFADDNAEWGPHWELHRGGGIGYVSPLSADIEEGVEW